MKNKPCRHEYTRHLYKEDGYYKHKYKCSKCTHEYLSKLKIPVKDEQFMGGDSIKEEGLEG